ncbi:phospholipase A2 inhibitor and Ly6/PLAUR domain-containing protein-like [Pelodiscus sinensis]|uniref:phospholipase A2 inhibitor and Ly6/PLAUR domain-containing protein-like n=1 Tax=Pelodiscus sinensis TaxID=13735 RepID=UPI003F6B65A5
MKAPLAACLLTALLAMGACLLCEFCAGPGADCRGDRQSCSPEFDSCSVALTDRTWEREKNQATVKACLTSRTCKAGPVSVSFGKAKAIRTIVACCQGDGCSPEVAKVPPANTTLNGRRCPGCYAHPPEQCREETIDCVGPETQCIDITVTTRAGGTPPKAVMKGCATETACTRIKDVSGAFPGILGELTNGKCTPAASTVSAAVRPAGLFLPALSGLLLLTLLS